MNPHRHKSNEYVNKYCRGDGIFTVVNTLLKTFTNYKSKRSNFILMKSSRQHHLSKAVKVVIISNGSK